MPLRGFLARSHLFPSAWVNAVSIPFGGGKGAEILEVCVYNMQTMSTISRPHPLGVDYVYKLKSAMPRCMGTRR